MEFRRIEAEKRNFLPLLLLGDEQEDMIDRYLNRGTMYVLEEDGPKALCVVTDEGDGVLELKNLATLPQFQRKGYGTRLLEFIVRTYQKDFRILQAGQQD